MNFSALGYRTSSRDIALRKKMNDPFMTLQGGDERTRRLHGWLPLMEYSTTADYAHIGHTFWDVVTLVDIATRDSVRED